MGRIQVLGRPNPLDSRPEKQDKQVGQSDQPNYIVNNPPKSSSTWAQPVVERSVQPRCWVGPSCKTWPLDRTQKRPSPHKDIILGRPISISNPIGPSWGTTTPSQRNTPEKRESCEYMHVQVATSTGPLHLKSRKQLIKGIWFVISMTTISICTPWQLPDGPLPRKNAKGNKTAPKLYETVLGNKQRGL